MDDASILMRELLLMGRLLGRFFMWDFDLLLLNELVAVVVGVVF